MKELYNGFLEVNRNIKRSSKICPRCYKEAVDKPTRRCTACKGVLLWSSVDSATFACERMDGWWMWHKSVFNGIEGWYPQGYFGCLYNKK